MSRRSLGLLASLVLLAGCGSSSTATVGPAQPPVVTAQPTLSESAVMFAAFRGHIATSGGTVGGLVQTFAADAGAGKVALAKKDAAKIIAWSKSEAKWEDANGPAFCYANVYTIWDAVRTHAEQAATLTIAGKYDASAAAIDRMTTASTSLVQQLPLISC
jgi:hypothetical protein